MGSSRALRWLLLVVLLGAVAAVLRARRAARLEWEQTWPAAVPPSTSPPDALAARRRPARRPAAGALPAAAENSAPQPSEVDEPVPARAAAAPTARPRPAVAPAPPLPADPEALRSPAPLAAKPSPRPRPRPAAAPSVEPAPAPPAADATETAATVPASPLRPRRPHLTLPETAAFAGPDGSPPGPEYTIKAKSGSSLFHGPDSPYFSRTRAEFWFRTAADARAAGLTEWTPRRRGRS
jgi:hypothetical protein